MIFLEEKIMKNIKLKFGYVIHSYNGEHDDHIFQLCKGKLFTD